MNAKITNHSHLEAIPQKRAATGGNDRAQVSRLGSRIFRYTHSPGKLILQRDVPREVAGRLEKAGFKAELVLNGVFAVRR